MPFSLKSLFCCALGPERPEERVINHSVNDQAAPQKHSRPQHANNMTKSLSSRNHQARSSISGSVTEKETIPLTDVINEDPASQEQQEQQTHSQTDEDLKPIAGIGGTSAYNRVYQPNGDIELQSTSSKDSDDGKSAQHDASSATSGSVVNAQLDDLEDSPNFYQNSDGALLPPIAPELGNRKCLVLDLDETLVHSSFTYIWNADFVIPVKIEGVVHDVYVAKRPGVDEFLDRVSELYEVVVFTASVAKYGDPLLDCLDPMNKVHHRLFRESCFNFRGNYIKNLSWLGRSLESVVIVDNSPAAYVLQPHNAVPVSSWFSDTHDNELLDMIPFLEDLAGQAVPNVLKVLGHEW